jgi:hypothetical protein
MIQKYNWNTARPPRQALIAHKSQLQYYVDENGLKLVSNPRWFDNSMDSVIRLDTNSFAELF